MINRCTLTFSSFPGLNRFIWVSLFCSEKRSEGLSTGFSPDSCLLGVSSSVGGGVTSAGRGGGGVEGTIGGGALGVGEFEKISSAKKEKVRLSLSFLSLSLSVSLPYSLSHYLHIPPLLPSLTIIYITEKVRHLSKVRKRETGLTARVSPQTMCVIYEYNSNINDETCEYIFPVEEMHQYK